MAESPLHQFAVCSDLGHVAGIATSGVGPALRQCIAVIRLSRTISLTSCVRPRRLRQILARTNNAEILGTLTTRRRLRLSGLQDRRISPRELSSQSALQSRSSEAAG